MQIESSEKFDAREEFIVKHFNEAKITENAKTIHDVYASLTGHTEESLRRKQYLELLLKIMGN